MSGNLFKVLCAVTCFLLPSAYSASVLNAPELDMSDPARRDYEARALLVKASLEFVKKEGLILRSEGLGSSITGDPDTERSPWALLVTSDKLMTVEEGIVLAQAYGAKLMDLMEENVLFERLRGHYNKGREQKMTLKNCLAFRLAFWDANVNRPLAPYLAEIRLVKGEFKCYYANPKTQALEDPPIRRPFVY